MKTRYCAVAIIHNAQDDIFICKKPENRGIYPGQWALPGGGIDEGEKIADALRREVKEETGLDIDNIAPFEFADDTQPKHHRDGRIEDVYMVYLVFDCMATSQDVTLDDEHEEYAWVPSDKLKDYDLNAATVRTFQKKGWL